MNLLKNKEILRALLETADVEHTAQGGSVYLQVGVLESEASLIFEIKAPSVQHDQYDVSIYGDTLVVGYWTVTQSLEHPLHDPVSVRHFKLPNNIVADEVSAFFEAGKLRIEFPKITGAVEDKIIRKVTIQKLD